ncbi:MAG: S16 family serine protease [Candidatus Aenigmatarchaeota archaeon]
MPKRSPINAPFVLAVFVSGVILGTVLACNLLLIVGLPAQSAAPTATPSQPVAIVQPRSASARIVGISAETGEGILGTATVELVPGRGRILISTNPFIEPDTQQSVGVAKAVAENFTGLSLETVDIIASFNLPDEDLEGQVIGGPSAGAALALAIAAAAQNKSVRRDVAITGAILPNGKIGAVGGILEKARAAGKAGMALFIVPHGQSETRYYEKTEERQTMNGFSILRISYVPRTLTLNDYTKQWNMTTVEAYDISEAARYAITSK